MEADLSSGHRNHVYYLMKLYFGARVRSTSIPTLLVVVFSCSIAIAADDEIRPRPNILLLMTDQHAATAMSCVGNHDLKTPALDPLAAEGVRFDRAYVTQPLCHPCWSSLQTGRYPHEIGAISNGRPIQGYVRETEISQQTENAAGWGR